MARRAWKQAEAAFAEYERAEAGGKIAHGALAVFGPVGRLNDRSWASQQIALALPLLSGPEWSTKFEFSVVGDLSPDRLTCPLKPLGWGANN